MHKDILKAQGTFQSQLSSEIDGKQQDIIKTAKDCGELLSGARSAISEARDDISERIRRLEGGEEEEEETAIPVGGKAHVDVDGLTRRKTEAMSDAKDFLGKTAGLSESHIGFDIDNEKLRKIIDEADNERERKLREERDLLQQQEQERKDKNALLIDSNSNWTVLLKKSIRSKKRLTAIKKF